MTPAAMAAELMKLTRAQPMTREQLAYETGWAKPTVEKWSREFSAQGLLIEERAPGKSAPFTYRLAPQWGGPT